MSTCIVRTCFNASSKRATNNGVTFHRLPKDEQLRASWLRVIKTEPEDNFTVNNVICSNHFLPEDFSYSNGDLRVIKEEAKPSQNLPSMTLTESKLHIKEVLTMPRDDTNSLNATLTEINGVRLVNINHLLGRPSNVVPVKTEDFDTGSFQTISGDGNGVVNAHSDDCLLSTKNSNRHYILRAKSTLSLVRMIHNYSCKPYVKKALRSLVKDYKFLRKQYSSISKEILQLRRRVRYLENSVRRMQMKI